MNTSWDLRHHFQPSPVMKTYKAFTLVETLSSVAIVGLLAAIALTYAGSSRTVGLDTKLNTDVSALNQALASYVGFGGSVSDIDNPIDVLTRLKSQQLQSETSQSAGLTGSYVDLRLRALLMDESEAKSNDLRAIWDPDAAQFVISRSGFPAVKAFYLSSDEEAVQFESRPQFFTYAAEDKWVWDFQDRPPLTKPVPTTVRTSTPDETPSTGGTASPGRLLSPVYSVPGVPRSISDFPFLLTLSNPNPGGTSNLVYRINGGTWTTYSGPFAVDPSATVIAYSQTTDTSRWLDSSSASSAFGVISKKLETPVISSSAGAFDKDLNPEVTVTLADPNPAGLGKLYYTVGAGYVEYTGPFKLSASAYDSADATILAYVNPVAAYYTRSDTASATIAKPDPLFLISAKTSGSFHSAVGPATKVVKIAGNQIDWGDPPKGEKSNKLQFSGNNVKDLRPGVEFVAGSVSYRNGTVFSTTGITEVQMRIEFALNGGSPLLFDYVLETVSTTNNGKDPRADADYVKLPSQTAEAVTIEGHRFILELSFGWTTKDGFSTDSEFYVLENESATAEVRGKFIVAE